MNILIKFSGEFFDAQDKLKQEGMDFLHALKKKNINSGYIVVGGGNRLRGASSDYSRNIADQIGVLSTLMNGMILKANLEKLGMKATVFSHFQSFGTYYTPEIAQKCKKEEWVILTTGLGQVGYISTDLSAVIKSLELNVDAMLKVTKVAGVYDKDPINIDAKLIEKATYTQVLAEKLKVLDLSALQIAKENNLSIGVCNIENFADFLEKKGKGSVIGKDWR